MPIESLDCPSHKIAPEWQGNTAARLTLDEADAFQGNRDFILNYRLKGKQISSGLLLFQGEDENFFLYMAQPPKRVEAAEIPPREYIFVVDVSGSMSGFPLETSKRLLEDLIGNLRPTDFFNVILFSGDSTALSEGPPPANADTRTARAFHDGTAHSPTYTHWVFFAEETARQRGEFPSALPALELPDKSDSQQVLEAGVAPIGALIDSFLIVPGLVFHPPWQTRWSPQLDYGRSRQIVAPDAEQPDSTVPPAAEPGEGDWEIVPDEGGMGT